MNHFYAGYPIGDINLPNVKLTRYSSRDHFHAFFSRPGLTEVMSPHFKSYFQPVVYELMDNSYKYGKAKQFEIKIGKDQIQLIDNGIAFNPIKGLDASKASSESHIGSFVLESFLDIFKNVMLSYERKDDENIIEFNFKEGSLLVEDGNLFEMTVDLKDAYGRENAKHLAEKIPTDVNEIVLNITNIFNISAFVEFTKTALERMEEDQKLTMFLPRHAYLSQFKSWFADERLIIHTR